MKDHDKADHHKDKAAGKRSDLLYAADAHRPADDELSALLQILRSLQEANVVAAAVDTDVKVRENALDDLAEGKRHDGEIVAPETQHRNADEKADDGGKDRADGHRNGKTQRSARNDALERHRRRRAHERPHAHKARVAERQLAHHADGEVERDGHDDVSADRHEHAARRRGQHLLSGEDLEDDIRGDHKGIGDPLPPVGFHSDHNVFHRTHLTLSRGPACPADRTV